MSEPLVIPDVHLLVLKFESGRLIALRDDDHLLRRFGQAEVRRFSAGEQTHFTLRAVADEIWAPAEGAAEFILVDRRGQSPSKDKVVQIRLTANKPQSLLIPFGVAYSIRAESEALLLRLATHVDGAHSEDESFSADEFSALLTGRG